MPRDITKVEGDPEPGELGSGRCEPEHCQTNRQCRRAPQGRSGKLDLKAEARVRGHRIVQMPKGPVMQESRNSEKTAEAPVLGVLEMEVGRTKGLLKKERSQQA